MDIQKTYRLAKQNSRNETKYAEMRFVVRLLKKSHAIYLCKSVTKLINQMHLITGDWVNKVQFHRKS